MRSILFTFVLLFAAPFAVAQSTEPQKVIAAQIDAFQDDDFDLAFTFASPTIQSIFLSSEQFGNMVVNGYPMVWRPKAVRYLDTPLTNRPRLLITDQQGRLHLLEYDMVQGADGWRINGVQIVPASGA
ncbi:DUF4864 domain-containing protein [Actibacterium pelagium]|uniref:DUF4864 domain-containing protein n=1 Tax=Actibacterium pelagium TaxID=2029103 RepID=A0A917AGL5_9RHOB|nr:DUF4864 domain-containing protein [Actibacterium pelagium]GGE49966.1 hypothetical protein GCM10011517_17180 [Actibacterium pelagium]